MSSWAVNACTKVDLHFLKLFYVIDKTGWLVLTLARQNNLLQRLPSIDKAWSYRNHYLVVHLRFAQLKLDDFLEVITTVIIPTPYFKHAWFAIESLVKFDNFEVFGIVDHSFEILTILLGFNLYIKETKLLEAAHGVLP